MATVNHLGNVEDRYFQLVLRYPLRPIRSDQELNNAVQMVDSLLDRRDLAPEEEDYLEVVESFPMPIHVVLRASVDGKSMLIISNVAPGATTG